LKQDLRKRPNKLRKPLRRLTRNTKIDQQLPRPTVQVQIPPTSKEQLTDYHQFSLQLKLPSMLKKNLTLGSVLTKRIKLLRRQLMLLNADQRKLQRRRRKLQREKTRRKKLQREERRRKLQRKVVEDLKKK